MIINQTIAFKTQLFLESGSCYTKTHQERWPHYEYACHITFESDVFAQFFWHSIQY